MKIKFINCLILLKKMFSFQIENNYSAIRPNGHPIFFIGREKALLYEVMFELINYFKAPLLANSSA